MPKSKLHEHACNLQNHAGTLQQTCLNLYEYSNYGIIKYLKKGKNEKFTDVTPRYLVLCILLEKLIFSCVNKQILSNCLHTTENTKCRYFLSLFIFYGHILYVPQKATFFRNSDRNQHFETNYMDFRKKGKYTCQRKKLSNKRVRISMT